ncbi:MAG: hypothetical protein ACK560_09545 [Bacteroidota bacterium]
MGRYRLRPRTRMRTIHKMAITITAMSVAGMAAYFVFIAGSSKTSDSNAGTARNMMIGYEAGNGAVIMKYDWEDGQVGKAATGPDAVFHSKFASCSNSGADNSVGLSPGTAGQPLNLVIPSVREMNLGGIDISIDYRLSEQACELISRGDAFVMSVKDGKLAIVITAKNKDNKKTKINEVTRFAIPADDEFRTYRFLFDPVQGKAEMFVNGITVWTKQTEKETELAWKDEEPVVLGRNMRGDGSGKAFVDNLVLKATRQISELPVTLLSFEAAAEQDYVMISWYTASEEEIDSFIVEKSSDAKAFIEVGRVAAKGAPETLTAYALVDKNPVLGVAYYRLKPSNKPLTSMTISMIGYKYKGSGKDMKLSDIAPGESSR